MTLPLYFALDVGTSIVKAGAFDPTGRLVALAREEYPLAIEPPDRIECDPTAYWDACATAMRGVVAVVQRKFGSDWECRGIAGCSQGETLICLDGNREPLRPAIVWLDNRATAEAAELADLFDADVVYRKTGQTEVLPTWTASKLLWLARHDTATYRAARWYCLPEDFIISKLSGEEPVGEPTLYPTSLLLDIHTRTWWQEMLDAVGVQAGSLPRLAEPGTIVGRLCPEAAEALMLPRGVPVLSGTMDTTAAACGTSNLQPGMVTESTGTGLALTTCVEQPPPFSHRLTLSLHAIPNMYLAEPYETSAGMALRWIRDKMCAPWTLGADRISFDQLIEEAGMVGPTAEGLVVLPHFTGSQLPTFDPYARGAIVGLTPGHTRGHVTRAILEAVGYMTRAILDLLAGAGLQVAELRSVGGGSSSAAWRQIKADICKLPIRAMEAPESALLGTAMLVRAGVDDCETLHAAAASMVRTTDVRNPSRLLAPTYDRGYERYLRLQAALDPWFDAADGADANSQKPNSASTNN